jgi:2-phosphoglycerate kinase
VLLIGGPSGVGKTTVAVEVAARLGAAWLMVDDLRLALARSGLPVPIADEVGAFDAPGGLLAVGALMTPAVEVVIENHVDGHIPVVIEGDGILPSLFERASVRARAANGRVRAVFLYEPDEEALYGSHRSRGRGLTDRPHARKNFLFGQWLKREAERRGLPTLPARPWDTLADRILAASRLLDPAADP